MISSWQDDIMKHCRSAISDKTIAVFNTLAKCQHPVVMLPWIQPQTAWYDVIARKTAEAIWYTTLLGYYGSWYVVMRFGLLMWSPKHVNLVNGLLFNYYTVCGVLIMAWYVAYHNGNNVWMSWFPYLLQIIIRSENAILFPFDFIGTPISSMISMIYVCL